MKQKIRLVGSLCPKSNHYNIQLPIMVLAIIIFSCVQTRAQRPEPSGPVLSGKDTLDISKDTLQIEEVEINAGYYTTTDRYRTGNIGRVTAKEIDKQPVSNPLLALHGRIPGVVISQQSGVPGNAVKIQIRGQNSLREDANFPLYVVDGVPIGSEPILGGLNGLLTVQGMDPLNTINPQHIASIEILKDADATAIYGSRGANGVVLITTKQGMVGQPKVDISLTTGLSHVKKLKMLNTVQYLEMRKEAYANDDREPTLIVAPDLLAWDQQRYTNWQEVLLGNTSQQYDAQLALSGGQGGTMYRITGGRRQESMVFPGDMAHHLTNIGVNVNQNAFADKLKLTLAINYGDVQNKTSPHNFVSEALRLPPNAPALYDDDGSLNWENGTWENPFAALERKNIFSSRNLNANATFTYAFFNSLSFRTNMGYSDMQTDLEQKTPISSFNPTLVGITGNAMAGNDQQRRWIVEPQLLFQEQYGTLMVDALVGTTFQHNDGRVFRISSSGYINDALIGNVLAAGNVRVGQDDTRQYRYAAVFSRVGINWKDRYLINLTGRRDGSSRFGENRRFGSFGAMGAAWIVSNEPFINQMGTPFNFLKLRGSYGMTGNDQIGDYAYLDIYSVDNYRGQVSLVPTQLYNPDFSWEINKKLDLELEVRFFGGDVAFTANWFRNVSSNQLVGYSLPALTGFNVVQANLPATIENKGWEFTLTKQGGGESEFYWNTSLNLSIPNNRLLRYPDIEASAYANTYVVGKSLSVRRLYEFQGLDENGLYRLKDVNEDGRYDIQDRHIIREMGRRLYGGLQQTLRYRDWSLGVMVEYVGQNGVGGELGLTGMYPGGRSNQPLYVLNRWRHLDDDTVIQRYTSLTSQNTNFNNTRNSDFNIVDASFVRLRNVSLGYRFDKIWKAREQGGSGEIFVHGQNLATFSNYAGWDPELPGSAFLPPLRTVSFGVRLSF